MKRNESSKPLAGSMPVEPPAAAKSASPARASKAVARSRDRLVLASMGVVTAALAAMLYTQLGYSPASAALSGAAAWALFLIIHSQVKKSAEITQLKGELARLEGNLRGRDPAAEAQSRGPRLPGFDPPPPMPEAGRPPAAPPASPRGRIRGSGLAVPPPPMMMPEQPLVAMGSRGPGPELPLPSEAGPDTSLSQFAIEPTARWRAPPSGGRIKAAAPAAGAPPGPMPSLSLPPAPMPAPLTAAAPPPEIGAPPPPPAPPLDTALWPGTSLSADDPMRDHWAFRPRKDEPAPAVHDSLPAPAPASTIEQDLAIVQQRIKALADEVNAAEALKAAQSVQQAPNAAPPRPTLDSIDASVGALKATAATMREKRDEPAMAATPPAGERASVQGPPKQRATESAAAPSTGGFGDLVIPATAERIAGSGPTPPQMPPSPTPAPDAMQRLPDVAERATAPAAVPPQPPADAAPPSITQPVVPPHIRAIASAIEANRMDVFLQPIVGLANHAVSHYEVNVRLKSPQGNHIELSEGDLTLAGDDLVAMFDIARLNRAAALASRLEARGKNGSLLSEVMGPSITHAAFLENFARVYEERTQISEQLVLTLTQNAIEAFAPSAWQALRDMQSFGFRFALDRLAHVDMDFALLARSGFAFVKLGAEALTKGLSSQGRFVPADALCQTIAAAGLSIVASDIKDEATRARIFGFGVLLGQGQLFGGPRQVSVPVPRPGGHTAAA